MVEVHNPTFPKVKERIANFVDKLEDGKIVIVEVLSNKVKDFPLRLADLYLRAIEKYKNTAFACDSLVRREEVSL